MRQQSSVKLHSTKCHENPFITLKNKTQFDEQACASYTILLLSYLLPVEEEISAQLYISPLRQICVTKSKIVFEVSAFLSTVMCYITKYIIVSLFVFL
jgi:hypothetical protein